MPVVEWKMALDDPGDISAPGGTVPRARAMRLKLRELLHDRFRSVQYVLQTLRVFDQERDFAVLENPQGLPFTSAEEFCTTPHPYGLGWDEQAIEALWKETREIALGDFLAEQTRAERAQKLGQTVPALHEHGEIGRGRDRGDNVTSIDRGNSAPYLTARLRRDAPVFADALARGEYPSVRAACLAAGILTPPAPQIAMAKSRHKTAQAIVAKMGMSYAKGLMIELAEIVTPVIEDTVSTDDDQESTFIVVAENVSVERPASEPLSTSRVPPDDTLPYDHDRFYLGEKLCPHKHAYEATQRSLRYRTSHACVECTRLRHRRRRQSKPATNGVRSPDASETREDESLEPFVPKE
jgi:hypothetical protein